MVAQEISINCAECIKGNHNSCNHENCLCKFDKHGETLKNGVILDERFSSPKKEPMVYEQARKDAERLVQFEDEGIGNNSPQFALVEYVKVLILSKHMVSKFDLVEELKPWCNKYRVGLELIDESIEIVFSDMDIFKYVKQISKCLGINDKRSPYDKTQLIEAGEWIKGRYYVKRIELTGDLLFFNEQYYERDAQAHIRRAARQIIIKSKNSDIVEVVKYVEDTCDIITWKDIEKSIHLKCLLNGIYDIKSGIFSTKFSSDYIILQQIPHNYNESQTFAEIDGKVTSIIPESKARQSFYDFISTCFHPYTGVDYQFGSVGGTGTGKSQLGVLAELIIGEDNVGDATIHLIAKDQTTQKNMAYKMLNIDYDLNSESIKQLDVIKKWITQDKFTARGIYEQATSFKPMSRLMFMANDLYEISNTDDAEAIYDRTYIIRVDKKFRHQQEEIKRVMQKTATISQLEGIVAYLLKNATWIYENESYHNTISVLDVENIWNTYGNRIKMFIDKWIVKEAGVRTESADPFNKWMSHCITKNFKTKDKKQFSRIFDEIIGNTPTKTRINENEVYAYTGIRIKTDDEMAKEETDTFGTIDPKNVRNGNNYGVSPNLTGTKSSSKSSALLIPLDILKIYFSNIKTEKNSRAFRASSSHENNNGSPDNVTNQTKKPYRTELD